MAATYINSSERMFPRGLMRFHLNSSRIIAGTAYVRRSDGWNVQEVHRASIWRHTAGTGPNGWSRQPLEPEPGGPTDLLTDPSDTLVGSLNEAGVVGGGKNWQTEPWAAQLATPFVWTIDQTNGNVLSGLRLGSAFQQQYYQDELIPGLVTALGSGAAPLAGGWVGTRCSNSRPAPYVAPVSGSSHSISELTQPILTNGFPVGASPIGSVQAIPSGSDGLLRPLGWLKDGACGAPNLGTCLYTANFNSWLARWEGSGPSWSPETFGVPTSEHHAELFDSTASLGAGYVRWFGAAQNQECMDHAAVFLAPLQDGEAIYDIHDALAPDALRPRSRAAAVADALQPGINWLVAGSRYRFAQSPLAAEGDFELSRGTVWQGKPGTASGTYEWCGRRIDEIARELSPRVTVYAITDVLPGGACVGYGQLDTFGPDLADWGSPGGKLIVFTAAADYNGDLRVDGTDLGILLGSWGSQDESLLLDCDNQVIDGTDLGLLLGSWASGSDVARVNWQCSKGGWHVIQPIQAAQQAASILGFASLESLGDTLTLLSPGAAEDLAEVAGAITEGIIQSGGTQ